MNAEKPKLSALQPAPPSFVETRLGSVEYAEVGAGAAVLCLHGAMGGYDQGLLLARVLSDASYRNIAPSRPGYLRTPIKLGATPEQQADLFCALLDGLGIEQTAVMAVSGGGPSAIHFALRYPQRCWGLVLVSTVAQPAARPPFAFKIMKLMLRLPWVAASARRRALEQPESMAQRTITNSELRARTMQDPEAWGLLQALQLSTCEQMTRRFAGTDNDAEVAATRSYPLEQLSVPALVVHGTSDPMLPFERHGLVLASRIQGAELVALEGGEHAAIFSHREEARSRVLSFLRRHAPST